MGSEKITSLFAAEKARRSTRVKGKAAHAVKADTRIEADEADEDKYLQILKRFDMTTTFGPALGLTRLERWERASKLNLNPPGDVYKILTEVDKDGKWAECVWEGLV